jgi:hypothetical protein
VGGLLGDAVDLWSWRVTGSAASDPMADFQEELSAATGEPDERDLPKQPARVRAFVDALTPGERPMAAIVHLVLPHGPWRFLPDGTGYTPPPEPRGPEREYDNEWEADVRRQQHLLQASYADHVVGQILDRLREVDAYDDAVVVVTADHGVAFPVGNLGRRHTTENTVELMWVPLFVKAPGQTTGAVDDSNTEDIDIVPTIASLAGIDVPWDLPGAAAGSQAIADRGDRKAFYRLPSILDPGPYGLFEESAAAGLQSLLGKPFAPVEPGDDPVDGLYRRGSAPDVVGVPFRTARSAPSGAVVVDDRDRLLDSGGPAVVVSGTVHDQPDAAYVVAAVDETVVAASPVYADDGSDRFLFILPVDPPTDPSEVRFGLVTGSGELIDAGALTG